MDKLADRLHLLRSRPRHAFNAYLASGVLLDAGTRFATRRILRELHGHELRAHYVSHAHSDHQGASHAVCTARGVPLVAPHGAAHAITTGDLGAQSGTHPVTKLQRRFWAGPAHPVARTVTEGDEVGGFLVLDTPGHAPAHTSLWREADRVLIAFDVLFGRHPVTGRPGLHEPPAMFTHDRAQNRQQIRRLAALEPQLLCFGHGPPLRDAAAPLRRFAEAL